MSAGGIVGAIGRNIGRDRLGFAQADGAKVGQAGGEQEGLGHLVAQVALERSHVLGSAEDQGRQRVQPCQLGGGVRVVVDAGLARVPRTDLARGLGALVTVPVSRASAEQRAGRAGREGPGRVYRCWSAAEHERRIRRLGGAGLQIVGIGANGHLGFNEPGSPFDGVSRVVRLAEGTRRDNARYFGGDPARVPTHAITQGIATILSARSLVLLASGAVKAEAVARALLGPVGVDCPASALQGHPDVAVLLDREAAAVLERRLG